MEKRAFLVFKILWFDRSIVFGVTRKSIDDDSEHELQTW